MPSMGDIVGGIGGVFSDAAYPTSGGVTGAFGEGARGYLDQYTQLLSQYGGGLVDQQRQLAERASPEQYALREQLMGRVMDLFNPSSTSYNQFATNMRAGQALRGMADSPMGAAQESKYMTDIALSQGQNLMQSMAATDPMKAFSFVTQGLAGPSLGDIYGMGAELQGIKAQSTNWERQQMLGGAQQLLGGSGGGGGGGFGIAGQMFGNTGSSGGEGGGGY